MTSEEQKATWVKRWDIVILVCLISVLPIIVTIGLFWLELENRVDDVQESRAQLTYIGCLEQNERNTNANEAIKKLFDKSVANGEQTRAEADTAVKATKSIIDAIAPPRDCQALVLQRFGFIPEAPPGDAEA